MNRYAIGWIIIISATVSVSAFGQETETETSKETATAPSASGEPSDAASAEPSATEETSVDDEAMIQFEQGREFFNKGQFEKAAIALKRAFELRPGYKILYYLGWAESETGNYSRAVSAYNGYLADAPGKTEAARIAEVKAEVEKLKARVGSVSVTCPIEGAKVKVDNEVMGIIPLKSPIPVDIGKHEITVVDGPTVLFTEIIRIAGGQEIAIEAAVKKTQPGDAAITVAPTTENSTAGDVPAARSKGKKLAGILSLAAAGALAVGAAVTGALALDQESEIWDRCDPDGNCYSDTYDGNFHDDRSRLQTLGLTTDVLIGTAAAAAVVGTVLLVIHRKDTKEREKASAHRQLPTLFPGLAGISITGRF